MVVIAVGAPSRPLVRGLDSLPSNPPHSFPHLEKTFSFKRCQSSYEPTISNNFTNAWLRASDFNLNSDSLDEVETPPLEVTTRETFRTNLDMQLGVMGEHSVELGEKEMVRVDSLDSRGEDDGFSTKEDKETTQGEDTWIRSKKAKSSMMTAMTGFYCLFITIFGLVLELSHHLTREKERKLNTKNVIFGLYMYGCSIFFFIYMYVVLLWNPRWYSTMDSLRRVVRYFSSTESNASLTSVTVRPVTHASPSTGSLFLRLGAIVFGIIGVVYYAFTVFLCAVDHDYRKLSISLDASAIVFIFIQLHFIFCNSKISITGSHFAARLGTMHLIAANLWTWIRYVLMEEGVMAGEIREVFHSLDISQTHDWNSSSEEAVEHEEIETGGCYEAECILGGLSEMMYTAIVEYSLIAAAVMYIVWRNVGRVGHGTTYVKRKHQIRVDCSNTTTGLFLGLAFLAAIFTSVIIYYGYSILGKSTQAAFVYAITDMVQYLFSTIGCAVAIYQMSALKYSHKENHNTPNEQELLDQILLSVGLIGELMYSVTGLIGLTGDGSWQPLTWLLLVVHILRLVQVAVQTFLLYLATRLRVATKDMEKQPGKQAITFLLAANLACFLMNLFEGQKAGVSEIIIDFYGKRSWVFLVRSFSPLTTFYRFHSSVCFAEIWKNVYAKKATHEHLWVT